jgi:hypothetical protein
LFLSRAEIDIALFDATITLGTSEIWAMKRMFASFSKPPSAAGSGIGSDN